MTASLAMGMPRQTPGAGIRSGGPNDDVNVAVIGLGSTTAVGGVGGRGHQLIGRVREISGVKIVTELSDVDRSHLDRELEAAPNHGGKPAAYHDPRQVLDDKGVDAVVVALPNHWHALATVWACQAGKDVYVEKPFSYNLWEGQQMVAAAGTYGRMVQVGTQNRSSTRSSVGCSTACAAAGWAPSASPALVYRARDGIGSVDGPTRPRRRWITTSGVARRPSGHSCASSCTTSGTGFGTRATARWGTTAFTSSTCAAGPWDRIRRLRAA